MEEGESSKREIFSSLFVEGRIAGRILEEAMAHLAIRINGDTELGGLRGFLAGGAELQFRNVGGSKCFEFGRKPDHGWRYFHDRFEAVCGRLDGGRGMRARNSQGRRSRRQFLEGRLTSQIRRGVLDRGHDERFSIGQRLRGGRESGIFRVQPSKEQPAFLRARRNQADAARRWQEGDCRWVDNLKEVETKGVNDQGAEQKSRDGPLAATRPFPSKDQVLRRCVRSIHFGGVVARATEVIPRSRDKLVTSTTRAYGVRRSALIMMGRPSFFASSSKGPS